MPSRMEVTMITGKPCAVTSTANRADISSLDVMKTLREPKMPTSRPQAIFPAKQPTVKAKAKLPMTLGSIPLANSRKGRKAKI